MKRWTNGGDWPGHWPPTPLGPSLQWIPIAPTHTGHSELQVTFLPKTKTYSAISICRSRYRGMRYRSNWIDAFLERLRDSNLAYHIVLQLIRQFHIQCIRTSLGNIFRNSYKSSHRVQLTLASSWDIESLGTYLRFFGNPNIWKRKEATCIRRFDANGRFLCCGSSVEEFSVFVSTVDKSNSFVMEGHPEQKRS